MIWTTRNPHEPMCRIHHSPSRKVALAILCHYPAKPIVFMQSFGKLLGEYEELTLRFRFDVPKEVVCALQQLSKNEISLDDANRLATKSVNEIVGWFAIKKIVS